MKIVVEEEARAMKGTWLVRALLFVATGWLAVTGAVFVQSPEVPSAAGAPARPPGVPKDFIPAGGCVPGMGQHWISTKAYPFGPIYGGFGGRLVFVEYMIAQEAFGAGKSWTGLKVPPGVKVDHVDLEFLPKGHEGYEIPHYDLHIYFVPHATHLTYCPKP